MVITRRGKPVAVLGPWKPPVMTPERQAAIERISKMMHEGVHLGGPPYYKSKDELYDDALGLTEERYLLIAISSSMWPMPMLESGMRYR